MKLAPDKYQPSPPSPLILKRLTTIPISTPFLKFDSRALVETNKIHSYLF